jgi:hypothetical protein
MIKRTWGFTATLCVAAGLLQTHHSLSLAVENQDGSSTESVRTLGSGTGIARRGIGTAGPNALLTGDEIKVKFLPAWDGSPPGFLKTAIMPDGRVIRISAGNRND